MLYKTAHDYTLFRVFGCLAFVSTLAAHCTKFQPRAPICAFLGYPLGVKGYKFYAIESKQVFLSRDAVFHEEIFPFHTVAHSDQVPDPFPDLVLPHSSLQTPFIPDLTSSPTTSGVPTDLPNDNHASPYPIISSSGSYPSDIASHSAAHTPEENVPTLAPSTSDNVVLQKSTRLIHPPTYLKDYHCNLLTSTSFHASTSAFYPISNYISYHTLSDPHIHFVLSVSS